MAALTPFHLAFPVHDLNAARAFYGDVLGCAEGRSSEHWVDFDLFGHQIVAHLSTDTALRSSNSVDGHLVPVPHFGVVLEWEDFHLLAGRLCGLRVPFAIEPHIRFAGLPGEQATMFFYDPSGNALEFKSFRDFDQIFAKQYQS